MRHPDQLIRSFGQGVVFGITRDDPRHAEMQKLNGAAREAVESGKGQRGGAGGGIDAGVGSKRHPVAEGLPTACAAAVRRASRCGR